MLSEPVDPGHDGLKAKSLVGHLPLKTNLEGPMHLPSLISAVRLSIYSAQQGSRELCHAPATDLCHSP